MAGNDAEGKFYEALNESSDTLIDAVRAVNDRNHRFTTALIEEAQESQRESVELVKKWAAAPFDIVGLFGSLIESSTKGQKRGLDATRQWFGELADAQKETQQVFQRLVAANRTAGEASADLARGAVTRATQAVTAPTEGNGRKAQRQTSKASERSDDS
ncbi:MAG: hypothetical protein IIC89_01400 [Chloroflexi bacterium]|nr:hypothetical protein [Chloroflexota bacterium]